MQATIDDFWGMIWEQNVDTIVMLSKHDKKERVGRFQIFNCLCKVKAVPFTYLFEI